MNKHIIGENADKIQFELQHPNGKDKKAYIYLMLNVYF